MWQNAERVLRKRSQCVQRVGGLRGKQCAQSLVIRDKWLAGTLARQVVRMLGYVAGDEGWARL